MKIGNSPDVAKAAVAADKPSTGTTGQTGRAPANGAAGKVAAKQAPEASTKIELSSTATKLLSGVSEEGSFDAAKVGRITEAISQGKFTVNAEVIADKLIANAQEMIGRMASH